MGDDAEIHAQLSAQHRQHNEKTEQDCYAVGLQPGDRRSNRLWENPDQNAPAVEWWERKEIEHRQHHVDDQAIPQIRGQPRRDGGWQVANM
jgi:hypothetical protein